MSRTWFTSDLHFGHSNVIEYSSRPFRNVDEMNAKLIDLWNASVKDGDEVYCLGDMFLCGFKSAEPIVKQLRGKKILIQGNHDEFRMAQYDRLGFARVGIESTIRIGDDLVKLSHFPYAPPPELFSMYDARGLRYLDRRPLPDGERYLLHGHVHEHWVHRTEAKRLMINVGVDVWGYGPVSEEQIHELAGKLLVGGG